MLRTKMLNKKGPGTDSYSNPKAVCSQMMYVNLYLPCFLPTVCYKTNNQCHCHNAKSVGLKFCN